MSDDDIPIDIHSGKLLDWMLSRRHCTRDWQKRALELREKLKHAILDMPENDAVVRILQASYINYFHVQQIIQILHETEKDTKNFLGFYSSQRMKDWQEIENLYKKENVFLAESAQLLQRFVIYEIPAVKKAIAKAENELQEDIRKEKDYIRQSGDAKKIYERELARLGLEGKKLRSELLALASDLPAFLDQTSLSIQALKAAREYYADFRKYLLGKEKSSVEVLLPALSLLIEKGSSATVYEWRHGRPPSRVGKPSFHLLLNQDTKEVEESDEIDFGDNAIDFGEESIDFGDGEITKIAVIADEGGVVEGEDIAHGEDALGLLEHEQTRRLIEQQLSQLCAFLSTRISEEETESGTDIFLLGLEQRPAELSAVSISSMNSWNVAIQSLLSALSNPQKQHLFSIRSSPQYVETLVEELTAKRDMEGRCAKMAQLMADKQVRDAESAAQLRKQLRVLIDNTKTLKEQIELEVSKKYNGRPVHIMGGISAALQPV